jgi:hypothetical protein
LRYLYGDSAEFPEQYNFLETLRVFIECSAKAAGLEHEIALSEQSLSQQVSADSQEVELVSDFCEGVIEDVRARAAKLEGRGPVEEYADRLVETVNGHLQEAQAAFERESRARRTNAEAEIEQKREHIREIIDSFLTTAALGVESSTFRLSLSDQTVSLSGTAEHRGGIGTSFELDPSRTNHFGQPQKVAHIMPGLRLQVGMRKKFLSKSLTPEVVQLDDHTITLIDLTPNTCEVHISRRIDPPDDDLVITMVRTQEKVFAELRAHQGETHAAEESDMGSLESLWEAIDERAREALSHKRRLEWVKLDGEDVIAEGLVMKFVQRLIDQFAPIAREVVRRSPNKAELSLKVEKRDGVREELYVRKVDLVEPLGDLPESLRESYAALDIFPVLDAPRSQDESGAA